MADEPRKRSRFDQEAPERKSRFDRRSRSPARKDPEPRRSRSPLKSPEKKGKIDAAAAAAAAAARINAQINARRSATTTDVPSVRAAASPAGSTNAGAAKSPASGETNAGGTISGEVYQQDGDYIKDIEVNDLRNRYTLTKGSTQKMIKEKTGADVTTRGNYYPDKSLATAAAPPLYLHVTSTSKEGLDSALNEIQELMKQELPNLIDERRFRPRREPDPVERDSLGRRKWPEERVPINLEPIYGFNLRAQVVGQGGSYVKYIQTETRCRVQIKGRGSGFMENETGRESEDNMFLHVTGPDPLEVQRAKEMCEQLLETVTKSYYEFKDRGPRGGGYGGGGDRPPHHRSGGPGPHGGGANEFGGNGGHGANGGYGGGGGGYGGGGVQDGPYGGHPPQAAAGGGYAGGAQSPVAAQQSQQQQGSFDPAAVQQWVQYYQQHPELDPYAQYGGYGAMMSQYFASQQAYAGSPAPPNGSANAPPAPPPQQSSAPPPPPPGSTTGTYGHVPPPPGL